jgi:pimeloyl-ACP methyl ester carboxylesterase
MKIAHVNGVDLCLDTFGDPADPAILLISGAASAMDCWEDVFCERLAAGPRFVIRYDLRDTGQSTSYEAGAPGYTQPDLVMDVVGLLDFLELADAHIVGISMGGGIGQRLAVEHPERVASLTLISTSPGGPGGPLNPDLPPMRADLMAKFTRPAPAPDWSDRNAVIDQMVDGERLFAGSHPVDEPRIRELAGRVYDRTTNMAASMTNHWMIDGGEPVRSRLGEVTAPTLVLHGTEDPLFPYGHAEALAAEIPGAELLALDGVGHQMPPHQVWDVVIPAVLRHTAQMRESVNDQREAAHDAR